MALTPKNASDTLIGVLSDIAAGLNPETILGNKPVIDLRRRYDIDVELVAAAPVNERYRAIDLNTYDTSDGLGSCVGYGATEQEARRNLLDAIAECDAEPVPTPRLTRVVNHSAAQPPDVIDDRDETDPEGDDYRDEYDPQ